MVKSEFNASKYEKFTMLPVRSNNVFGDSAKFAKFPNEIFCIFAFNSFCRLFLGMPLSLESSPRVLFFRFLINQAAYLLNAALTLFLST